VHAGVGIVDPRVDPADEAVRKETGSADLPWTKGV